MYRSLVLVSFSVLLGIPSADAQPLTKSQYELNYIFDLNPDNDSASVTLELGERADRVVELRIRLDQDLVSDLAADGTVTREDVVVWTPPKSGGRLSYTVGVTHKRNQSGYDAFVTKDWMIFRGDDLVPPVSARTKLGAESRAKLFFNLPGGWSVVSPFRPSKQGGFYVINDKRRFHRPTGWILAGKIGQRIEEIAGVRVVVAAPMGHDFRRMDVMAFLQWNVPELKKLLPNYPDRLLVLGANDPMWRGGLSGPRSLFMHASRPIISENGTSTLLHEIMHTGLRISSSTDDWIVEGLAEFYSLELMRRSGTISESRFMKALRQLRQWSKEVKDLRSKRSNGPVTARAVLLFVDLDKELRRVSDGDVSLDHVARALAKEGGRVTFDQMRGIAEDLVDTELRSLDPERVPLLETKPD